MFATWERHTCETEVLKAVVRSFGGGPLGPWPHLRPEWTPAPRRRSLKEVADGASRLSGLLGRVTGQAAGCLAGSHRRRIRRRCSDGVLRLKGEAHSE